MSRYLDHEVWLVCEDVLGLVGASTAIVHCLEVSYCASLLGRAAVTPVAGDGS